MSSRRRSGSTLGVRFARSNSAGGQGRPAQRTQLRQRCAVPSHRHDLAPGHPVEDPATVIAPFADGHLRRILSGHSPVVSRVIQRRSGWIAGMAETAHWRQVIATLADEGRRRLYAQLVLAEAPISTRELDTATRRRLDALVRAGLAVIEADAARAADPYGALLAADPAQRATGPERFLVNGRLVVLPRTQADRAELFGWLADQVIARDERLSEPELTGRLADLADDPAAVRRYLVDAGALVRDPDGTNYRRSAP